MGVGDLIDSLVFAGRYPIHLFLVMPSYDGDRLVEGLKVRARLKRFDFRVVRSYDSGFEFEVRFVKRRRVGRFYIGRGLWIGVLWGGGTFEIFSAALGHFYPLLVRPMLPVEGLFKVLDGVSERFDTYLLQYLVRRRLGREVLKVWTRRVYGEVKEQIVGKMLAERFVVDAVRFKLVGREEPVEIDLRLDRFGALTIYRMAPGLYPQLERHIILPYLEVYFSYLRKAETVTARDGEVTSVVVEFGGYRLTEEDMELLKTLLKRDFYISVYHGGNPWLHVNLIDKEDGSNYQLVITEDGGLIVPGPKSSPASLSRIIDKLYTFTPQLKVAYQQQGGG